MMTTCTPFPREDWDRLVPLLPKEGLKALRQALETNDCRITREVTLTYRHGAVCRACPIAFTLWKAGDVTDPDVITEQFENLLKSSLGEGCNPQHLIKWVDTEPWDEVRMGLLAVVEAALDAGPGSAPTKRVRKRAKVAV